jgi:hypothetical protein
LEGAVLLLPQLWYHLNVYVERLKNYKISLADIQIQHHSFAGQECNCLSGLAW